MTAATVSQLIESLATLSTLPELRGRQLGRSGLSVHRVDDVADEAEYLASVGLLGALPIAKFSDGDQIALRPRSGQPLAVWPVMRFSHGGEGARTLASGLTRWVAVCAAQEEAESLRAFGAAKGSPEAFDALGRFFGDDGSAGRIMRKVIADLTVDPEALDSGWLADADPDGPLVSLKSLLEGALAEGADALAMVEGLAARFPDFASANVLRLRAALSRGASDVARDAARRLLTGVHWIDSAAMIPDLRRLSLPEGLDRAGLKAWKQRHDALLWGRDDPLAAAVGVLEAGPSEDLPPAYRAVVDEAPSPADAWKAAATELERSGDTAAALTAFENAAHYAHAEDQEPCPEAIEGALRCAAGLGDPEVRAAYELARGAPSRG